MTDTFKDKVVSWYPAHENHKWNWKQDDPLREATNHPKCLRANAKIMLAGEHRSLAGLGGDQHIFVPFGIIYCVGWVGSLLDEGLSGFAPQSSSCRRSSSADRRGSQTPPPRRRSHDPRRGLQKILGEKKNL